MGFQCACRRGSNVAVVFDEAGVVGELGVSVVGVVGGVVLFVARGVFAQGAGVHG